jgi:hypothetical protein
MTARLVLGPTLRLPDGIGVLGELRRASVVQRHLEVAAEPAGAGAPERQASDECFVALDLLPAEVAHEFMRDDHSHAALLVVHQTLGRDGTTKEVADGMA